MKKAMLKAIERGVSFKELVILALEKEISSSVPQNQSF
jgi:hypothetical protein